ncbi:myb-related protein MYBAS2-like [Aristolochia californica]|uniref:myb-related protein MYBAS2-like n=1 Tax=Aristolochia californica TaxID=171875 RepID=UPI0035E21293
MAQEETRKGPWMEQEDLRLVFFVGIFGERRWDFIAKVSGLNRTGKSCRLRWVNYLHPDLKRGRMTPQEERVVLELHSSWGNRWSRIARSLPGRTDNEIKNYWRTHMRKKAQERKRNFSPSSSSSCQCHPASPTTPSMDSQIDIVSVEEKDKMTDNGSSSMTTANPGGEEIEVEDEPKGYYSMDQIWEEIASPEMTSGSFDEGCRDAWCNFSCPSLPSPICDYRYDVDALWTDSDELKIWHPGSDLNVAKYQHGRES